MALSRPLGSALVAASLAVALAALFLPADVLEGLWQHARSGGSTCPLVWDAVLAAYLSQCMPATRWPSLAGPPSNMNSIYTNL